MQEKGNTNYGNKGAGLISNTVVPSSSTSKLHHYQPNPQKTSSIKTNKVK